MSPSHRTALITGIKPRLRQARELNVTRYVCNDTRGVLIEVEGPAAAIDRFLTRVARDAPPLAIVERVAHEDIPALGAGSFLNGVGGSASTLFCPGL